MQPPSLIDKVEETNQHPANSDRMPSLQSFPEFAWPAFPDSLSIDWPFSHVEVSNLGPEGLPNLDTSTTWL